MSLYFLIVKKVVYFIDRIIVLCDSVKGCAEMKVINLKNYIWDKVVLYKSDTDDFVDIYKGYIDDDTPETVLDLEIKAIGAKRSGVVDIKVE